MSILDADADKKLKIDEIDIASDERRKLNALGIFTGDSLIKLGMSPRTGPILISNLSRQGRRVSKIALGRELASKINVSYEL